MLRSWRWFGPHDRATLDDVRQAGARGIVTALHDVPDGEVWTREAIAARRELIEHGDGPPLRRVVTESLPVSDAIRRQGGSRRGANYRTSLENLAAEGVRVVCHNMMRVLDWTRTHLAWPLPHGGTAMRFDPIDLAAFDIHVLQRPGAREDFPDAVVDAAARRHAAMDDEARAGVTRAVTMGLPGGQAGLSLDALREALASYRGIDAVRMRANHHAFLAEVVPTAERVGVRLCCHPDDPPWPLLGLPRVCSSEADLQAMLHAVDSPANGVTLCSGSLGARPGNDLPGMMERMGERVHFLHLRNTRREGASDGVAVSFRESDHLNGDADMVTLIESVLREEARRREAGREDAAIPMRPDHGHDLAGDLKRGAQPGYPTVGRMKGLAELQGVEMALRWERSSWERAA